MTQQKSNSQTRTPTAGQEPQTHRQQLTSLTVSQSETDVVTGTSVQII